MTIFSHHFLDFGVVTRVSIEPGNWSRSGRIALVVTGNRSGYPPRNPPETSRWFGYVPDIKAGQEPAGLPSPFLDVFRGVLSSIKISLKIISGWIIISDHYKLFWNKLVNILFNRSNNFKLQFTVSFTFFLTMWLLNAISWQSSSDNSLSSFTLPIFGIA